MLTLSKSCFYAIGCYRSIGYLCVSELICVIILIDVTAVTGVCSISLICTGGLGHLFVIIVTKRASLNLCIVITTRAGFVCIPSALGAGGCLSLMLFLIMSKRGYNLLFGKCFFAYRAMYSCSKSCAFATCGYRFVYCLCMSERGYSLLCLKNFFTDRATLPLGKSCAFASRGYLPCRMCCKSTNNTTQKSSNFERIFIELTIFNIFIKKIKK